jgi:hypothetical protein
VDLEAQAAKGLSEALEAVGAAHPGKRLTLWCQML